MYVFIIRYIISCIVVTLEKLDGVSFVPLSSL